MGKRANSSSAATAAKAVKVDPITSKCNEVIAALALSRDLPQAVSDMIAEVFPFSLGSCPQKRHPYQQGVVEMVGKELNMIEEGLSAAIQEAEGKVADDLEYKASQKSALAEHAATLETHTSETHEKKLALASDATAFRGAKEALAEFACKQAAAEKSRAEVLRRKSDLEGMIEDGIKPLSEGRVEPEGAFEKATELMQRLDGFVQLDKSLTLAIPAALAKEPAVRGPFDAMVVAQLLEQVQKGSENFAAEVAVVEKAKAEQSTQEQLMREALAEAHMKQRASADAFTVASRKEEECKAALQAAKAALSAFGAVRARHEKAVRQARAALQQFRSGALAAFKELCSGTESTPQAGEDAHEDGSKAPEVAQEEMPRRRWPNLRPPAVGK